MPVTTFAFQYHMKLYYFRSCFIRSLITKSPMRPDSNQTLALFKLQLFTYLKHAGDICLTGHVTASMKIAGPSLVDAPPLRHRLSPSETDLLGNINN